MVCFSVLVNRMTALSLELSLMPFNYYLRSLKALKYGIIKNPKLTQMGEFINCERSEALQHDPKKIKPRFKLLILVI